MNVFDFDKTIFYPDSSYRFVGYCLRRYPAKVLKRVPAMLHQVLRRQLGKADTKELKQAVFSFLQDLEGTEEIVEKFWEKEFSGVRKWYLEMRRDSDLVISASPEFLIGPCCEKLGISYMGTRMDIHTGKIDGNNCHDSEKVLRFRERYPDGVIETFYSDSYSDDPMAQIAQNAVLVKKDELCSWGGTD